MRSDQRAIIISLYVLYIFRVYLLTVCALLSIINGWWWVNNVIVCVSAAHCRCISQWSWFLRSAVHSEWECLCVVSISCCDCDVGMGQRHHCFTTQSASIVNIQPTRPICLSRSLSSHRTITRTRTTGYYVLLCVLIWDMLLLRVPLWVTVSRVGLSYERKSVSCRYYLSYIYCTYILLCFIFIYWRLL